MPETKPQVALRLPEPKITPIEKPSGKLWSVTAAIILRSLLDFSDFKGVPNGCSCGIKTSDQYMNRAPSRNPTLAVTTPPSSKAG